jgi:hypothetical protein
MCIVADILPVHGQQADFATETQCLSTRQHNICELRKQFRTQQHAGTDENNIGAHHENMLFLNYAPQEL